MKSADCALGSSDNSKGIPRFEGEFAFVGIDPRTITRQAIE